MSILIAIPICIIYNLIVMKLSNIITKDLGKNTKIQTDLFIQVIGGMLALIFAFFIFGSKTFENIIVKWGLIFGGSSLLIYSLICNWDIIGDNIKLFTLFSVMISLIICSYKYTNKKNKQTNQTDITNKTDITNQTDITNKTDMNKNINKNIIYAINKNYNNNNDYNNDYNYE